MTKAYGQFLQNIGVDPNKATDTPPTIAIIDSERVIVRYEGMVKLTVDEFAEAMKKVTR